MRIGVVSDTHLPRFGRALPEPLVRGFHEAGIERILHLGDWTSTLAVDLLEEIAPLDGVAGNNDPPELVERFGRRKVVEVEGVRIGLTHGDLGEGRTTPERARQAFAGASPPGAILFGHSHIPLLEQLPGDRLLLNPGSPTDKRRQPRHSWALLDLKEGVARAELRFFDR
jgi:putative phosphoesterase